MEENNIHYRYHVVSGTLVKMSDNELADSLTDRVKLLIKNKVGIQDTQNKGSLYGFGPDQKPQKLSLEQLLCLALEIGITEKEIQTDTSLFHVIDPSGINHTFCIHDFETNIKKIYSDFAKIIIEIFDLEYGMVAPVILSNCHQSYLNEGIIFVYNDKQRGPTAQAIEKINPIYDQIIAEYS